MNEHDSLEKSLIQFRDTVPPESVRASNRKAVQIAFQRQMATHWCWRSIRVPLPVALATAAALLISLSFHLIRVQGRGGPSEPDVAVERSAGSNNSAPPVVVSTKPYVEYSETQRYLSGIGVIDRNIVYQIRE